MFDNKSLKMINIHLRGNKLRSSTYNFYLLKVKLNNCEVSVKESCHLLAGGHQFCSSKINNLDISGFL